MKHSFNKIFSVIAVMLFFTSSLYSQSVGVSDNVGYSPNTNAILDLDDVAGTKGALLPRMTAGERGIKGTPHPGSSTGLTASLVVGTADEGLTIFNTSTNQYNYWDGSDWQIIPTSTTGNTLDDAYDEGGAGAGRQITADNGSGACFRYGWIACGG